MTESDPAGLLKRLAEVAELIEAHRATVAMLEMERMRLQTELRRSGWKPPGPDEGRLA